MTYSPSKSHKVGPKHEKAIRKKCEQMFKTHGGIGTYMEMRSLGRSEFSWKTLSVIFYEVILASCRLSPIL